MGASLVQRSVCPRFVIIPTVFAQDAPKMSLSEDENVIKTLAAY